MSRPGGDGRAIGGLFSPAAPPWPPPTEARFGTQGLLLTVLVSGALLALVGALRLGSLIRHIPHAVLWRGG